MQETSLRPPSGENNIKTSKMLVSFAAVFWMSRNAPPKVGALRHIQKTAAKETTKMQNCSEIIKRNYSVAWHKRKS